MSLTQNLTYRYVVALLLIASVMCLTYFVLITFNSNKKRLIGNLKIDYILFPIDIVSFTKWIRI